MVAYYSTQDLCERFRCSSRTLFRRMNRPINPFPSPCMKHVGSSNIWDAQEVHEWEYKERERCKTNKTNSDNSCAPLHQSAHTALCVIMDTTQNYTE